MTDIDRFNAMVSLSDVELRTPPTFESWFTRGHQKVYIFNLAAKLFVEHEVDEETAIRDAARFINTYYDMVVNPHTREEL